jgi:hypothetical protein
LPARKNAYLSAPDPAVLIRAREPRFTWQHLRQRQ